MLKLAQQDLSSLVRRSAARGPEAPAIIAEDGRLNYRELDRLADRLARAFADLGVRRGDRVGLWMPKATKAVAAMQGVLRLGAAYVPIDSWSPIARAETILRDCDVRVLVTDAARGDAMCRRIDGLRLLVIDEATSPTEPTTPSTPSTRSTVDGLGWADLATFPDTPLDLQTNAGDDLAYVLYTSGSTGRPKGVRISHGNALAFVDWAGDALAVTATDRLANHAPFHFDLSVLDLYVSQRAGACVALIPEALSFSPAALVDFASREEITIWYSVPSVLALMLDRGGLEACDRLSLRAVLFAGEPFAIKYVRRLRRRLPQARLLNLYGPTETNVCTFFEVAEVSDDDAHALPIGRACSGDRVVARDSDGREVTVGEEGELWVDGPTVMLGYWGAETEGAKPYATGDIVRRIDEENYALVGRRDAMVKVRGYRIEPGEIEAALHASPKVSEAAVAVIGTGLEARLFAFVVPAPGATPPTLLELKRQCAERLPAWMVVDAARIVSDLPRTSTGKVDRRRLPSLLEQSATPRASTPEPERAEATNAAR